MVKFKALKSAKVTEEVTEEVTEKVTVNLSENERKIYMILGKEKQNIIFMSKGQK